MVVYNFVNKSRNKKKIVCYLKYVNLKSYVTHKIGTHKNRLFGG